MSGLLSDQAHAMSQGDCDFANLWFAAQRTNWPLATYYLGAARSHLEWVVRIKPERKDPVGRRIKLEEIRYALDSSLLRELQRTIEAEDRSKFETAYRAALEGCYACHKALDKPYLRPQVPERPQSQTINFDPQATWPP